MAIPKQSDPRKNFVPRWLPLLLAAAMLAVYCLTLDHWVSLFNLVWVAKISGWMWQPDVYNPLLFLATYPFRWLSAPSIPVALNLFSAVCAALTLGLLARSVALLPHDRTDAQREREKNDFSFLTIRSAWLPPVLAVAVCGLQITFWEHATNCTGEMFDLLLFAFVVWSLIEYRLDEREGRLYLAALVYGAGMAENWAMVGFAPVFLTALIWIRGFGFFDFRFLTRMALCCLAGMLFYLLLPFLTVISGHMPWTFWEILKLNLGQQWQVVKLFFTSPNIRMTLGLLSFSSLVPVFLLSIRWKSSFGDSSPLGLALASFMFHLIHAVFLVLCIWMAFDPQVKISARHSGFGTPFLTFYYLGALSVGYYSGYFLLIFGKKESGGRSSSRRRPPLESINRPIFVAIWLLGALAVVGLVYRNVPQIRSTNGDTLHRYASLIEESLPRTGGYLLSDDPKRLVLVQSILVEDGRAREFVPLDTQSLNVPTYHNYLHRKYPGRWPGLPMTQTNMLGPIKLMQTMAALAKTNDLYYLHPSFGYYFEEFYQEPHGLVYKLETLPAKTLLPPLPDKKLIAENETFWNQTAAPALMPIESALAPPDPNTPKSWGESLLAQFHVSREPYPNSTTVVGTFYSQSLDFWGVELQRAGHLTNAATSFDDAIQLNPDNVVAQINLQFNEKLAAGTPASVDLSKSTTDRFGQYGTWEAVLDANGPFDEPSFCFETGLIFARNNGFFRQAMGSFNRVCELVPDNLPAHMWLGQLYLFSRLPERALDALRGPLDDPQNFSPTPADETQLHELAAAAYFQENNLTRGSELLEKEIALHPDDNDLLTAAAAAYMLHGLYDKALVVIDRKLQLTPNNPGWLYGKGYVSIQLKNYDTAITALTRVLELQTNNNNALFNRAIANLDSGHLDAARADYTRLQKNYTNSVPVAYGLGDIAWHQHDTNEAIRNYKIYLANARTNSDEAKTVLERLRELQK